MTIQAGESHSLAPIDGLSHVTGDRSLPLLEDTIPQALARTVARVGDRPAAVFPAQGVRVTWAEFASAVERFTVPQLRSEALRGVQPPIETGSSVTGLSGV